MDGATRAALQAFPALLGAHFEAFAPELHTWAPASWDGCPSEPFTALEQLCHVRDVEIDGYQVRFRRTLAEDNPYLPDVGGFRLRDERRYREADSAEALGSIRAARAETLTFLDGLDAAAWTRPAFFEDYGPTTLRGLVHFLCSHDQQHLAGLQWLLGQSQRTPSQRA